MNNTDNTAICSRFDEDELMQAHRSLLSTLRKCEKVLESVKLQQSQRTLTERRVAALKLALRLIEREQDSGSSSDIKTNNKRHGGGS